MKDWTWIEYALIALVALALIVAISLKWWIGF
jgi:Flp pilus assembly pilin Flp